MQRLFSGLTIGLCACLASDALADAVVDFESVTPGTQYGDTHGQTPGDVLFTENGVVVGIDNFIRNNLNGSVSILFGTMTIGGFTDSRFPTTPATISNVQLTFDLSGIPPVNAASFEYYDRGGRENLAINGTTLDFDDFLAAPSNIGGVAIAVSGTSDAGTVTLSGPINSLAIGGQELGIDNVTFVPEPTSLATLAFGGLALLSRRRRAQ